MSAQIIAFPLRVPQPDGQERLQRALAKLEAALEGQRTAVAAWRGALGELQTTMSGLGDSVRRYRDSLDTLGERVDSLHGQAVALEQTADRALGVDDTGHCERSEAISP